MKQLLFSILLFAIGCSGGEISLGGNAGAGLKDVEVTMTFTVGKSSVSTDTTVVTTKADVVGDAVRDLWIGQYDASGNLLIYYYLKKVSAAGNSITLQLKESADCNIYLVANAGDLGKVADFDTYRLAYTSGGLSTSEGIPASGNMPFFGSLENQQVSVSYKPATVELSRLLGHVKLSLTLGDGFGLTVKSVSLCSVPTALQCKEPTGQASGISYQIFSKTSIITGSSAVYEWYVPENKAGTIPSGQDGYAADERHKCGGNSVPNATYIEVIGDIEVDNVTYSDIQFRLYPGENANDYSIKRNRPYEVNLTLTGIDFSDPRVLLTIPDMVPLVLGALPDQAGNVQITARPGYDWSITLPDWLSAKVNGTDVDAGSTLSHKGPVPVEFTTKALNLYAEEREFTPVLDDKQLSVKQSGSALSVSVDGSFGLEAGSLTVTIDATDGLPWTITTTDETNCFTLNSTTGIGSATLSVSAGEGGEEIFRAPYQITVDGTTPARSESFNIIQGLVWDGNKLYVEKADRSSSGIGGSASLANVLDKTYAVAIEIDDEDMLLNVHVHDYKTANSNCAGKYATGDWRLPTIYELVAMYHHKEALSVLKNINIGTADKNGYMSSSQYPYQRGALTTLCFAGKRLDWWDLGMGSNPIMSYRCVRTITAPK